MASPSAKDLIEAIAELKSLRKLLQTERRSNLGKYQSALMENKQLRDDKRALLEYIKELERFSVDKIDVTALKEKML